MNGDPRAEASRSLAARFTRAVAERWDRDRCDVEARGFLAELTNRGWRHTAPDPAADWRTAPRAERDPQRAHQRTDELRLIARQARDQHEPAPETEPAGGTP
jgi:hypothetical protein